MRRFFWARSHRRNLKVHTNQICFETSFRIFREKVFSKKSDFPYKYDTIFFKKSFIRNAKTDSKCGGKIRGAFGSDVDVFYFQLFMSNSFTSLAEAKRFPSFHLPFDLLERFFALEPTPLEPEVQNG